MPLILPDPPKRLEIVSLKLAHVAHESGSFERESFTEQKANFQGLCCYISFREGTRRARTS